MSEKELLQAIYESTQHMEQEIQSVKHRVTSLELTIENETNRNIRIIAEGHLDLLRKLDEALKVENEKEILQLRFNHLENELRKVKERLSQIA